MKPSVELKPEDFIVEEVLRSQPGNSGDYAVYVAKKWMMTTVEIQERIARQLGVSPRAVVFPALKDKRAVTTQHFSLRGNAPSRIEGRRFTARLVGRLPRHLTPKDLLGNRFIVTLPGLSLDSATELAGRVKRIEKEGFPNYFDEQRFGSYTPGGVFLGKAILKRDAEEAIRAYLTQPAQGDPLRIQEMKAFAYEHWGNWQAIFERAPRSNYRSLLTFLKDHPDNFRKAVNLITPRLLPLFLGAYQSYLWNRIASRYLTGRLTKLGLPTSSFEIMGEHLVLYESIPISLFEELRSLMVPMPNHRAIYRDSELKFSADEVLKEEGLEWSNMKARILKRAYLTKGSRQLIVVPQQVDSHIESINKGGGCSVRLSFFLSPGSYGTLALKLMLSQASSS